MPVPMLHQTDLFRPHEDPDDHWDLACVYALAARGDVDLRAVLIDHPPRDRAKEYGDPDIGAVAQLNRLAGLQVPCGVGSAIPVRGAGDTQEDAPPIERTGVELVLRALREAPTELVINVVGSCRDLALAINTAPALFAERCAAIYLNAGTGEPRPSPGAPLEYNVALNPEAYGAIFAAPCPIYWMPCFESLAGEHRVGTYGTWYRFRQDEILPALSPALRRYFAHMLARSQDASWLRALDGADDSTIERGNEWRNMWCTAGFFHAAGYTVAQDGRIGRPGEIGDDAAFVFDPVDVTCEAGGATRWTPADAPGKHFIFRVTRPDTYPAAMTGAMRTLLQCL